MEIRTKRNPFVVHGEAVGAPREAIGFSKAPHLADTIWHSVRCLEAVTNSLGLTAEPNSGREER